MASSFSALAGQIRYLLHSLNDSNSETIFQELSQYAQQGTEESTVILRSCLDHLNINGKDLNNVQLKPLYGLVFKYLLNRPNISTVLCESLRDMDINVDFIANLSHALRLELNEKIGVGLALLDSENPDISNCGKNYCMAQIEEISNSQVRVDSDDQIHNILMFLHKSEGLAKHVESFQQMLSLAQLKEDDQYILAPLLSNDLREEYFLGNLLTEGYEIDFVSFLEEMEKEISMADVIKELGYGCTINVAQCKEMLFHFFPLTEIMVAKLLGTIARTNIVPEDNQNAYLTFYSAIGNGNLSEMPSLNSWNIDVLVESINQLVPGINWVHVMENLDHEGFYIPNEEAFSFFMSFFRRACQDPFPLNAICGSVWKNREGQLSFLKYAVSVPPEIFSFANSGRQLIYADVVHIHKSQLGLANHAWLCLDLLEVLCQLAELGHENEVRLMLKRPLEQCPEVLLLGMAHINTSYNLLQFEVSSAVFPKVLKNSLESSMILNLWQANPNSMLRGLVDAYNFDPNNMGRILEICEEIKIVSSVLDMVPSYFGIRLAVVASRRELLDLEKWLSSKLIVYKDTFFEECLKFLKDIQFGTSGDISSEIFNRSGSIWKHYSDATPTVMKVLQAHVGLISSSQLLEEMGKLLATNIPVVSALKSGGTNDSSQSDGYTDDIEEEANSYFQKMFSGELTIDVMIQMLGRFKESGNKRERSLFECMIGNLFEEYKFFPKYPEMQLKIAAVLFGSLIKHQLVTHLTLGIALRGVLDALRKTPDSKMFVFGTMALEQFVDRLIEWPQCCNHILQISHLRVTHPELVAFIERALAKISSSHSESDGHSVSADQQSSFVPTDSTSMEMPSSSTLPSIASVSKPIGTRVSNPVRLEESQNIPVNSYIKPPASPSIPPSLVPSSDTSSTHKSQSAASLSAALSSSTGFARPTRSVTSARFGSALNIETLVAAAERKESPLEAPASEIQDKISFIVNNLSVSNFEAKAKDFAEILKEPYYPWFAQYMVMKRASIEPNFHDLYLKFLEKVSSRSLNQEIAKVTYENCKVLLGSDLIKSSSEERSLLKNLGSWLGKITIGRNQVLRAREIDLKALIMEAYEKGLMIAVIPFTSKVLEPCQSSVAYRPPNPFTMGILGLLTEIYTMPNLKMNLKFEIEVLFKNLGVDMKDVTPTSLLHDRVRQVEGNPDFSNKDVGVSQHHLTGDVKPVTVSTLNQVDLPIDVASPSRPGGHSNILSQYAAPVHLSSGMLTEDLGLSDQLASAQGLLLRPPPFSASQLSTASSGIEQQVVVNPKLHSLGLYLHFQSVVPIAMERAIKETVTSIVQRSVSIATQTTKELVLKDYAMEMDETRIRNAAHLMVASLAGSLAHVTCKEPLRGSIASQLRNSLPGINNTSEIFEQAVQLVTNDNLDLGCALIEQSATEKAIQAIDGDIAQHLSMRRKQRESAGSAYFENALYTQSHMGFLPEALRPKPGRLSHSQQRVYEDFVRLPWQNQSGHMSHALPADSLSSSVGSGMTQIFNSGIYSSGTGSSGVSATPQPLDLVSDDIKTSPTQNDRASLTHVETGDGTSVYVENDVVSSAPESQSVDTSTSVKDFVASSQSFPSIAATECLTSEPLLTTGEAVEKYYSFLEKLENLVINKATDADIQRLVGEIPEMILKCIDREQAALAIAQKVFQGLYENALKNSFVTAYLAILTAIRDVSKLLAKELTSWVIYSEDDQKFNKEITVGLIRSELLNLAEYNVHMAKLLDGGRNKAATEFSISLIQMLLINDSKVIPELPNLVDALSKLATRPGTPESLQQLVEVAKNPSTISAISSGKEEEKAPSYTTASREDNNVLEMESDPAGFRDQVSGLFAEWYRISELPGVNDGACAHYVLQLLQSGLLKGNDTSDRFFRCLTDIAVSHCLSSEVVNIGPLQSSQQASPLSFLAIDIYAKLVFAILKGSSKATLLPKILAVTVRYIQRNAEEKKSSFNPRPYFRLFINWLLDLGSMEPVYDGANFQILSAFANAFHSLHPLKVPGFSFAWLELISHKSFMPKLLTGNSQKGWPYMQRLLIDLFQFLEPFLRNAELGGPVHFLYKGTLRVLLVLLHDFPEFLCDYHFSFCDIIPPSCIQMRNIVLSAFPRNMRLPDPSTPNLKIDLLAEITQSPRILSEADAAIKAKQIKGDVDEYLKNRQQGSSFLTDLKQKLLLPQSDVGRSGTRYNVPLINSLVLYVGMQAIQQLQAKSSHAQSMASNVPLAMYLVGAALDIFQALIIDLDTEGRYLFLNAIANQLRYPNNHTHYFSFVLLYLFAESNQEIIQEQITRVLLERLIVNRPHPWGLLITFIELIKNPRYNFWGRSFTRCAPEIEKLFESVSRSCGGPKPVDEGIVSGGLSDNLH